MRKGNSQKQIKKPLTIRERRLIKGLAEGLTTTDALRKAGYAESTVRKQSGRTVGNSRVLSALKELMEKKGLSDSALIDSLAGGLKSTRVISARVIEKNAGAADNDFVEVPDYPTRHAYLRTALQLKGHFPDPRVKIDHNVNQRVSIEVLIPQLLALRDAGQLDGVTEIEYEEITQSKDVQGE